MIIELAPGIRFIRAEAAGFPYGNSLLIDSDLRAIIDTGAGSNILQTIEPAGVDLVLNTHYHKDHTGGNAIFDQARILMHRLDYPPMVDEKARDFYAGFFEWDEIMGSPRAPIRATATGKLAPFKPARVDGFFEDNEVIDFGHTRAKVLHLPGHTPGHCGFYFEKEDILFGGDIDLVLFGPFYGDYLSSIDDFIASIRRVLDINPHLYCSSHRKPLREDIPQVLTAYLEKIEEREAGLRQLLNEPCSLNELMHRHIIYPKYNHPYIPFWERRMIEKHLDRMLRQGEAILVEEDRYRLAVGS